MGRTIIGFDDLMAGWMLTAVSLCAIWGFPAVADVSEFTPVLLTLVRGPPYRILVRSTSYRFRRED